MATALFVGSTRMGRAFSVGRGGEGGMILDRCHENPYTIVSEISLETLGRTGLGLKITRL